MKNQHLSFASKLAVILAIFFFESMPNLYAQQRLSLTEAIATTIHNNRRIRIDSAAIGILKERTRLEKGVLLPRVEFNTQVNHYFQQPAAFNTAINTAEPDQIGYVRPGGKDLANADLSMEMPLLNLQQRKRVESTTLAAQQYGFKASVTKIDLRAEVKQAYLRIIMLEKRVRLYHTSMQMNLRAFKDARDLFVQGKVPEEDTIAMYLAFKSQEPDLLKIQNAIQVSKQLLNLLMGAELKRDLILTDTITFDRQAVIPKEEQIFQDAMASKPSIKILEFDEEIAKKNAEAARSSALPVIKSVGQYAVQTQVNDFNYNKGLYPTTSFVGLKMTIPIVNGNAVHAKKRIAVLEGEQARFRQQVAWKLLGSDISEILGNINETKSRISTQTLMLQTADKNYARVCYGYEHSHASRLELTDALNTVVNTESNLIAAGYNFELAMIELERLQATDVNIF